MIPHIFRVRSCTGKCWVIADDRHIIRGVVGESRMQVVGYWEKAFGQPPNCCYLRWPGLITTSAARRHIAELMIAEGGAA